MGNRKGKRIVICADGTWNDPEDENPTNVMRIARAIKPVASDGVRQVVFYDWGVGTYHDRVLGSASGVGISKNVQDCYRFIVQNYYPNDQIYLFGFSRGAYTVRCLAGMLNNCGILHRDKAHKIPDAFNFYKNAAAKPGSSRARRWRERNALSSDRGSVEFIGVWDTVGALGIPTRMLAFVDERDLFFDPELGSNVKVACHAVSIDEQRKDFEPTLWSNEEAQHIKQVWFAGVHADVGGGYEPQKGKCLSDIPLVWIAREAEQCKLQFERHLCKRSGLDAEASVHESYKRFWRALGRRDRELPADAKVHSSVKKRFASGRYKSPALEVWLAKRTGRWTTLRR